MDKAQDVSVFFNGQMQRFQFECKDWLAAYTIEFARCYNTELLLSWIVLLLKKKWMSEQVAIDFISVFEKVTGQSVLRDISITNSVTHKRVDP